MKTNCAVCNQLDDCNNTLKDTFTDLDSLQGRLICKKCEPLFDTEWLKTGFYWTEKLKKKCQQKEFADIIQNPELPCLISFSKSRKKHRLFRSKWTTSINEIHISTDYGEEILSQKDIKIFNYLNEFYQNNKISKTWILEDFPVNFIKKIGIEKYLELQNKIKSYKDTTKLVLLVDFLNKE